MKQKVLLLALLTCAGITISSAQNTLGFEDFDGNAINLNSTTNVADYNAGGGAAGDVFGRVDGQAGGNGMPFDVADDTVENVSGAGSGSAFPADQSGIAGMNTTAFFALNDMDEVGVNNSVWSFSGWGTTTIGSVSIDIAAMGDFEAGSTDGFLIEASIDGGAYQELFRAKTDETASKTYRPLDGGLVVEVNDPLALFIDGSMTPIGFLDKCDGTTGNFDTYTSNLLNGQIASSVDVRIRWQGTPSGSEPMGIDNITVIGAAANAIPALLISEVTVTPTAGEFIEIFNPNSVAVDLTDVYLTDATFEGGATYYYNIVTGANAGGGSFGDFLARFPNGASIGAGEYQTIAISGSAAYESTYASTPTYELFEDGETEDAVPDMLEGMPGSINGQGGLTNGGEVALLFYWDGQTDLVSDLDYVLWGDTAEAVDKSGISIDGLDADSDATTYKNDTPLANQQLVAAGAHNLGESFQRNDFSEGSEIAAGGNGVNGNDETSEDLNNTWCSSPVTAGIANMCASVEVPLSRISEVQGSELEAAMAGTTVKVQAVVVADYQVEGQLGGFFIQEEDADADADSMTSEGIFVYCNTCPTDVAVGDLVEVTGLVVEFFGMTQIDVTVDGSINTVSAATPLPTPATLTFPAPAGTNAEGTFENVEGMLIIVTNEMYVSEYFELARFGQLVLSADQRIEQFTDANEPDAAEYAMFLETLEKSRIILDDDNNIQNSIVATVPDSPYFWPRPGLSNTNFIRGGDQISDLTGIMHWSFSGQSGTNAWRLRPVADDSAYNFSSNNPREAAPGDVGGNFKVASFNVLNYFTTLNERGANSTAELNRQREKISAAICGLNADVVGLIEIENNGLTAINDLLNGPNGINALCGTTYAAVETGVIGTDEIAVAFIYNTATVSLEGAFAILDSSVDPLFNDDKNRPALAQTFRQISSEGLVTVVVNHLKSKGSDCNDVGDPNTNDGSGNCNQIRTDAATAIVDWLATDPTGSEDPDFLIIGDLNSYKNETPIDAIKLGADNTAGTADDYSNLIETFQGEDAYGYVFDGQLGYLDYALATKGLATQITGTVVWHINADEVNVFDYNDGVRDAGESSFQRESNALPIYEPNAYRASDHDPVLIGINLGVAPVIICPSDVIINNTPGACGGMASFNDATASDANDDLDSVLQTSGPSSGSIFPVGTTVIEFTATDLAGNSATCSFNVIVNDTEAPEVTCQDITVALDENGVASIIPEDITLSVSDNCGLDTISIDISEFDCSHVGDPIPVTLSVSDLNGTINTCTASVTVVDISGPVITCPVDQTVLADENSQLYTMPDYFAIGEATAIDTCTDPVTILSQDPAAGTALTPGIYPVVLEATDAFGNSTSCSFELTVESFLAIQENIIIDNGITLYPNPANDVLNLVNFSNVTLKQVVIYTIDGKSVYTKDLLKMDSKEIEIDISTLASGTYLVKIETQESDSRVKRMVKK